MFSRLAQYLARLTVVGVLLGFSSNAMAYYDCGWYGPNFEWECIWIPDPPPQNGDEAEVQQERYYLKTGDLNGDGKSDFLVTGAYVLRRVQDFILLSNSSGYQTILYATLNPTQQYTVSGWPVDNAPVSRVDINLDGKFDFYIGELVDGNGVGVLTNSSDGRTPVAAVVVDELLRQAGREIGNAIQNPGQFFSEFDAQYTYWIEYWAYIPLCGSYGGESSCGYYWYSWYVPYTVYGRDYFAPATRNFVDANRTALSNGSLTSAFASASLVPAAAGIGAIGEGILTSQAMRIAVWGLRFALVAAAAPAVGTAAVVTMAAITVGVLAYGAWEVYNDVYSDPAPSDVGNDAGSTPANPDPFDPCQRDTSVYQSVPDDRTPENGGTLSIGALRAHSKRNLERTGCNRPSNAEAHHGIPLRDGKNGAGDTLREWARTRGVNLTSEANQVYLPKNPNVHTRAAMHNSDLHSEQALQEFHRRLILKESQGMQPGDALRAVNNEIATGNFRW
jgi:hypothetical protein